MRTLSHICAIRWLKNYSTKTKELFTKYSKLDNWADYLAIGFGTCSAASVLALLTTFGKDGHPNLFRCIALALTIGNTAINTYQKTRKSYKNKAAAIEKLMNEATAEANKLEISDKFDYGEFLKLCGHLEADLIVVAPSLFKDGSIETMIAGRALNKCVSVIENETGGPG